MRIGDKVRLLKGTEEGFIVNIKGNIVEIEIEDGFTIPAVKNEVVIIDKREAEAFNIQEETEDIKPQSRQSTIEEGIYLGIEDEEKLNCFFINQTPSIVLYSVSIPEKKTVTGFAYGICEAYGSKAIGQTTINPQKGEIQLQIQAISFEKNTKFKRPPVEANLIIKKNQLSETVNIMSLERALALFNLEKASLPEIDPHKLKEQLIGGSSVELFKDRTSQGKEQVVDLHINPLKMNISESEILAHQLHLFEKSFDQAILSNAKSLKVIHGIGSGKLRNEIHKIISQQNEVKYFEDGDKEKFGFGSTIIYF